MGVIAWIVLGTIAGAIACTSSTVGSRRSLRR
jgi:hypothetical protein